MWFEINRDIDDTSDEDMNENNEDADEPIFSGLIQAHSQKEYTRLLLKEVHDLQL